MPLTQVCCNSRPEYSGTQLTVNTTIALSSQNKGSMQNCKIQILEHLRFGSYIAYIVKIKLAILQASVYSCLENNFTKVTRPSILLTSPFYHSGKNICDMKRKIKTNLQMLLPEGTSNGPR